MEFGGALWGLGGVLTATVLALSSTGNTALTNSVMTCLKNNNKETMLDPAIEVFKVWPTFRDRSNYRAAMTAIDLVELTTRFPAHFTQTGDLGKIGMNIRRLWRLSGISRTSSTNGFL